MFSIDRSNHMWYNCRGTSSTTLALENAESIVAKQVWMVVSYGKFAWMDIQHHGVPTIQRIVATEYYIATIC